MKIPCPSSKIPEALALVEHSFRPAPGEALAAALAKLRFKTVRRDQVSEQAQEAEIAVYAEELRKYPADVAISVLADWPDDKHNENRKWFPAWPELKDCLDRAASGRRLLQWKLMGLAREAGIDEKKARQIEVVEESPEHRARVVEECLASLGMAVRPPGGQRVSGRRTDTGTEEKIRNEAQARLDALEAEKPRLPKLSEAALKAAGIPVKRPEESE